MAYHYDYIIEEAPGPVTRINGREYLYFAGTGYFQLNARPEILRAASEAVLRYGTGSATSRSITGTTPLLLELERKVAEFFGTEDAAYLPSGYLSNIAGMKALAGMNKFDVIFLDEGSHYSLAEAALTTGRTVITFSHRNVEDLKDKLAGKLSPGQRPLIATDGLFPLRALPAPLREYADLAGQYDGVVWIDDAHGVGIRGRNGRGSYEHYGLRSERLFMGATLSKAFGAYGGIIPGDAAFIARVKAGSVMTGTNAPMNAAVAAGIKGVEIVAGHPEMREKLWDNASYLKKGLRKIGIPADENDLPVVVFAPGDEATLSAIHSSLMEQGIYIQLARYKGSGNSGILRIVVFSTHERSQIDTLLDRLKTVLRDHKADGPDRETP